MEPSTITNCENRYTVLRSPTTVHDLPPVGWLVAARLTCALGARLGCRGWWYRLRKRWMPRLFVINHYPVDAKHRVYSTQGAASLGRKHKGGVTYGQRGASLSLCSRSWLRLFLILGPAVPAATPPSPVIRMPWMSLLKSNSHTSTGMI